MQTHIETHNIHKNTYIQRDTNNGNHRNVVNILIKNIFNIEFIAKKSFPKY